MSIALKVPCPICLAAVDVPCLRASGEGPHHLRLLVAETGGAA